MKREYVESYGPWALVTGASSGIGKAFAYELARQGLNLILVARTRATLEAIALDLHSAYAVKTTTIDADLGDEAGVETVLKRMKDHEIGLYIGAAGFGSSGQFVDLAVAEEAEMIQVNCSAAVEISHAVANQMRERGRGGIVLFASLLGWQGVPLSATYSATKAFIQSFAEAIRVELKESNIDVLSVAPGPVLTGFDRRASMKYGRGVTPEQVASESLRALGKKTTVVPGSLSKILTYSLFTAPRSLRIQIMRQITVGLSNHGKKA